MHNTYSYNHKSYSILYINVPVCWIISQSRGDGDLKAQASQTFKIVLYIVLEIYIYSGFFYVSKKY